VLIRENKLGFNFFFAGTFFDLFTAHAPDIVRKRNSLLEIHI